MGEKKLSHFDTRGNAHMVNIAGKAVTARRAVAEGSITMLATTLRLVIEGRHAKGDVLSIARVAGIMATKRTAELIPLCHSLSLTHAEIDFEIEEKHNQVRCEVAVETCGRTGVEIEALTAVQITLLTIYDMCKKLDRGMVIGGIRLLEKSGGNSGHWKRNDAESD